MLQLAINYFYIYFYSKFVYIYIFSCYFWEILTFYPLGILLSLYVLVTIYYMAVKLSYIIITFWQNLVYFFEENMEWFFYINYIIKHLTLDLLYVWSLLLDMGVHYSIYKIIFYLKRVELYIVCFFIIVIFC